VQVLFWCTLDFNEISCCNTSDIDPLSLWGVSDCSAQCFSDKDLGSIESSSAAVSSIKDLNFHNGISASKRCFPPCSFLVSFGVHASEFTFAPVGIEVPAFDWIPWFIFLMLECGTHCDSVLVKVNLGEFNRLSSGSLSFSNIFG